MSAPSLDLVVGPLLVGTWVNSILYGVELLFLNKYVHSFPNDDWSLKALVFGTFAVDTVAAIASYASVYLYTISHSGDFLFLAVQNWTFPLLVGATAVVAIVVQLFLLTRYYRFAKNVFITLFVAALILTLLGASLAVTIMLVKFPNFTDRPKYDVPITIWLISESVTDVLIALALIWEFRKVRTPFEETQSTINRLANRTLQTGTASATIAVVGLITYLTKKDTSISTGFAYIMGHVYVITMLSNLNFRATASRGGTSGSRGLSSANGNGAGAYTATRSRGQVQHGGLSMDNSGTLKDSDFGGIQVHRTAVVKIDPDAQSDDVAMQTLAYPSDKKEASPAYSQNGNGVPQSYDFDSHAQAPRKEESGWYTGAKAA